MRAVEPPANQYAMAPAMLMAMVRDIIGAKDLAGEDEIREHDQQGH